MWEKEVERVHALDHGELSGSYDDDGSPYISSGSLLLVADFTLGKGISPSELLIMP